MSAPILRRVEALEGRGAGGAQRPAGQRAQGPAAQAPAGEPLRCQSTGAGAT